MAKPKQPPKPALAAAEASARQALEARIAELQAEKDKLADRLTRAEKERENWRKEAANAHTDVATQTFELGKRDLTIARLEADRDYDRERFNVDYARLGSELEAAKETIAGLARQLGVLSAAAQARANNDAADAARSSMRRQKEPCGAGHPTSDPTGF